MPCILMANKGSLIVSNIIRRCNMIIIRRSGMDFTDVNTGTFTFNLAQPVPD